MVVRHIFTALIQYCSSIFHKNSTQRGWLRIATSVSIKTQKMQMALADTSELHEHIKINVNKQVQSTLCGILPLCVL
jgi:hypothetical protein